MRIGKSENYDDRIREYHMNHLVILDYSLWELLQQKTNFTVMQTILIGLFFLICGLVLCAANWGIQVSIIAEFGYPKRSKREKRMGDLAWIRQFRPVSRVFLWSPCRDAQRKGFILWLAWLCNLANLLSCVSCCVGYPLAIVMRGVGWPILMMLFPPFEVFAGTIIIEFIPRLIFLPSDRRRYGLDRRHKRNY